MASTVVEVSHVEQLGLKVLEVCLIPQSVQNFRLGQVWVGNLVVVVEQSQQLTHVVEVVPGDLGEAELVEVAEGNGREGEVGGGHLVQLGDVRVLQVVRHPVHAHQHQQSQGAQEGEGPEEAAECHMPVGKYVTHAMEGRYVGESLQVRGPDAFNTVLGTSFHGCGETLSSASPRTSGQRLFLGNGRIQTAVLVGHYASFFIFVLPP